MPFRATSTVPGNHQMVPAQTTPANRPFRVVLVYKNMRSIPGVSHTGLGVTAVNTSKVLRAAGIYCDVWGVMSIGDLRAKIKAAYVSPPNVQPVTHIVISAPWLEAADLQDLAIEYGAIEFAVTSHSNVGFLAADPGAFKLIRQYMAIETGVPNFHLGANSSKLCNWISETYSDPCWLLPNLYYLDGTASPHRAPFTGGKVKIGCFGANRILKNALSAGAAALQMASEMRLDLEFYISGGRNEGAGGTVQSMREMFAGVHYAKLVTLGWEPWHNFRQAARSMDLLMQPSFTESFNVVTADGVAEGVASVVSHAIDWVPQDWQANPDEVSAIAQVGRRLLLDHRAPVDGMKALVAHNTKGLAQWL